MTKFPMTVKGAELLREELNRLKTVDRPNIIKAIAEARALGDLKENAEYHAAKEQQSFLEGRILQVEQMLGNAQIIDITSIPNTGKIIFGVTVTLLNLETEKEVKYNIVGDSEADLKQGKISISSPIARGLIGKKVSDDVEIKTPNGSIHYEIIKVEHI